MLLLIEEKKWGSPLLGDLLGDCFNSFEFALGTFLEVSLILTECSGIYLVMSSEGSGGVVIIFGF